MTFTAAAMRDQIVTALGEMADEFDIDAIETEIRAIHGVVDIDSIDFDEFQTIAARHAIETEA